MPVFENRAFERHEWVSFIDDRATGLRAIIEIHSTALGPAGGVLSGASAWMGMGEEELRGRVEGIYDSCSQVFARAEQDGVAPSVAAERLAKEVIEARSSGAPVDQGASS